MSRRWSGSATRSGRASSLAVGLFVFSDVSGRVLVVDPSAAGRASLSLRDVPWDYALLLPQGFGTRVEGNRLLFIPRADP